MKVILTKKEIEDYNNEILAYNTMKAFEKELERNGTIQHDELSAEQNTSFLLNEAMENEGMITSDLKDCLDANCHFEGLDNRIKSPLRLKDKIITDAEKKYGGDCLMAANNIFDTLRYTIILPFEHHFEYLDNYLNDLLDMDYEIVRIKNKWGDDYCKGVSVILSNKQGFKFEIQFHTQENYDIKEIYSREPYNLFRDKDAPGVLRNRANQLRSYYHSLVKLPEGALDYEFRKNDKTK